MTLVDTTQSYGTNNIAAGTSQARTFGFTLPNGAPGVGSLQVTITADSGNSLFEYNGGGTGETNNSLTSTFTSTIAAYPDLQVTGISMTPAALQSGQEVTLNWNDANTGNGSASGSWSDHIVVVNTTTGVTLVDTTQSYGTNNIAAGTSQTRTYGFTLPNGTPGVGSLQVTITADSGKSLFEYNTNGTEESNNTSTSTFTSTIAAYPDLQVTGISMNPAALQSGQAVTLSWNDANTGNGNASGAWSDHIIVVNTTTGKTLVDTTQSYGTNNIAAGTSQTRTYGFTLPNGTPGVGSLQVTITADSGKSLFEYNTNGTEESNNTSTSTFTSTIAAYPDLQVTGISMNPTTPQSGQVVTLNWNDANTGNETARGYWYDHVVVVNTTTGKTLLDINPGYNNNSILAGAMQGRSYGFTLPDGVPGVGSLQVTITADAGNNLFEYNTSGTEETNNVSRLTFTSTIAAYPDLQVIGLSTNPVNPQSGQAITLNWNDANTGNARASGSWSDHIVVVNTTTGQTLRDTTQSYNANNIEAGTLQPRSYSFTLPNGTAGVGTIQVTVTTDAGKNLFQYNASGTEVTNNTSTTLFTSTLAAYPDLIASDVIVPSTALPGQQITVSWTLANQGSAVAVGPWTAQVLLADDATGTNAIVLGASNYSNSLTAAQSTLRSLSVQVPILSSGAKYILVRENVGNTVFELETANDQAASAQPINIPIALVMTLANSTVSDAAGVAATYATITRNSSTASSLVVSLANSDVADVVLPEAVTIPAGQSSVKVPVGTINTGIANGTQTAVLTASAAGFTVGSASLTVTNVNRPQLSIAIDQHIFNESAGSSAATGTVTRNTPTTSSLVVSLISDNQSKVTVPATVTIPAGQSSATFSLAAVDDTNIDATAHVHITASASQFNGGADAVDVLDDDAPTLTMSLATHLVSEGANSPSTTGTVTRTGSTTKTLAIALTTSDSKAATVPARIYIRAGSSSATFPVAAVRDGLAVGDRTAVITAQIEANSGAILAASGVSDFLVLAEADGPALTIAFPNEAVRAGNTMIGTVTRNTDTTLPLTVTLNSGDTTHATVPASVVIPAGKKTADFVVTGIDDHLGDGLQYSTISATTPGFGRGVATLGVTSIDLPDLTVTSVIAPQSALISGSFVISWTVTNKGLYSANGSWVDRVFIDQVGQSPSSTLVDKIAFDGNLGPAASYTQSATLTAPSISGEYIVRVVTDQDQFVEELSFSNNSGAASQSLAVIPPYHATVLTNATTVPNGTPIHLTGTATLNSGGPAANVPVDVRILVNGTRRVLTATTNSNGNYNLDFQPLFNEAGEYSVAADHPGVLTDLVQTHFEIVGLSATPAYSQIKLIPDTPVSGQFVLSNLSAASLTGLTATAQGGPDNLDVQFALPSNIDGSGTVTLAYSLTAVGGGARHGVVQIHVTSAEGAVLDIPFGISVVPLKPQLNANPGSLNTGMVVGSQTLVSFSVVNNGGAPSGTLQVTLPNAPFLSLASDSTIASLAPGASTTVTLALTPAANFPLLQYSGSIALVGSTSGLSIPFTFRAITNALGDVHVLVDDDFTFHEAGSPHVIGAKVDLLDPYDNSKIMATGTTDNGGAVTLNDVPAGPYVLRVRADGHQSYQSSFTIKPGITNNSEVFVAQQLVKYTWTVVPKTIEDTYEIVLQTSFNTEVPVPVVTIDGPSSLPVMQPGQTEQINLTLTNHGLIAANNVMLTLPTDPEYTFTALTTQIGTLPAMSTLTVPVVVHRLSGSNAMTSTLSLNTDTIFNSANTANSSSPGCTLVISGRYYYQCGGNDVYHDFFKPIHIPLRPCGLAAIELSLPKIPLPSINVSRFLPLPVIQFEGGESDGEGSPLIKPEDKVNSDPLPAVQSVSNCDPCKEHIGVFLAQLAWDRFPLTSLISTISEVVNSIQDIWGYFVPQEAPLIVTNTQSDGLVSFSGPEQTVWEKLKETAKNFYEKHEKWSDLFDKAKELYELLQICTGSDDSTGGTGTLDQGNGLPRKPLSAVSSSAVLSGDIASGDQTSAEMAAIQVAADRLRSMLDAEGSLFPSSNWLQSKQSAVMEQWLNEFVSMTAESSDGSISDLDRSQLLAMTLPSPITVAEAGQFIDRWNRTVQYWSQGIFAGAQIPQGQSTDFLDLEMLSHQFNAAKSAIQASQAEGFTDPYNEAHQSADQLQNDLNGTGACATIKLQIDQKVTLTRAAFDGVLQIVNGESAGPLDHVKVNINITDADGNPANDKFFFAAPTLSGLTGVDGTGSLASGATGSADYTFIPTEDAAVDGPALYHIGGTLSYLDPDTGMLVTAPMFPATITVYPQAQLKMNYFLQRDVIGDDPFTLEVESSEPAVLGVLVTNVGKGAADNFSITSAQPQIVENLKGLLATFQIIGTQVGTQAVTPSLTTNFGDIDPGATGDAEFLVTSSLQGQFTNFTATFKHSNALGGTQTSLIKSVTTHDLVHAVEAQFPTDDHQPDYLVDDTPNPNHYPDTLYLSDGTVATVNVAANSATTGTVSDSSRSVQLTANMTSGWSYIKVADPGAGFILAKVVRSDGKQILVGPNAWTTNKRFDASGGGHIDHELHLLDYNGTGSYTLYYKSSDTTPPAVSSLQTIASPQHAAVPSIDVTFSRAIDPTTLTWHNMSLTFNGGANLITSDVTITQVSPTTFTVGHLANLTANYGNYVFKVTAANVIDLNGDLGSNSLSESWATGLNQPVIVSVGATNPSIRNTPEDTADVVFFEPIDPTTFDVRTLSLSRNGGSNLILNGVSVTQVSSTIYRISGLSGLTANDGAYVLSVGGTTIKDFDGHTGAGAGIQSWSMDTTRPTISVLQPVNQSPRSIIVPSLDVTFSKPIDPTTFDWHAISFSKVGGTNLADVSTTVTRLTSTTFRISGFNNFVFPIDGTYTFTVSAAGVRDLAGNFGIGSVSNTWVMDTAAPNAATSLAISPDFGVSSTDGITNTGNITLAGTVDEPDVNVKIHDMSTGYDLPDATLTGNTFAAPLNLAPGKHELRVTVVDAAANVSKTTYLTTFVDTIRPAVSSLGFINPGPVGTEILTLNKAILPGSFDYRALALKRDSNPENLITSSVSVTLIDAARKQWRINGLDALTNVPGNYKLTVDASQFQDTAGNQGIGSQSISWSNAIDITPPTSTVAGLPAETRSLQIPVSWSGTDNLGGVGIQYFDIYVSDNGGPYTIWQSRTTATARTFTGTAQHTYSFYSRATDYLGNVESAPSSADASTTLADFATIQGTVFNDINHDGTQEAGEAGLSGWTVFVDANQNGNLDAGERFTISSIDGKYLFDHLEPGDYTIAEVLHPGWTQTFPDAPTSPLTSSMTISHDVYVDQTVSVQTAGSTANNYAWQDQDQSTPDVIDIYYDFRSLNGFANQITSQEMSLAEKALSGWADASGGKIHFIRNTTTSVDKIIDIGTGDLAALGYMSGELHTMGVGGGTFSNVGGLHTISSGVVWLDQLENWDLIYGNGNPTGTRDYYSIVTQEIAHALGVTQTGIAPDGAAINLSKGQSQVYLFQSHCGCGGLPTNAVKYSSERTSFSDHDRVLIRSLYGGINEVSPDSSDSGSFYTGTGIGYSWQDQDPSTSNTIEIYYDFRSLNSTPNLITETEIARAEQALSAWTTASGGILDFIRNTTASIEDIIDIGVGDLAALGSVSAPRGILALGGGNFTVAGSQHVISAGEAWLDSAETWDDTYGNGNPTGSFDFFTVVSHEIGHALGLGHSSASLGVDIMNGTYSGELTTLSSYDQAIIRSLYRLPVTESGNIPNGSAVLPAVVQGVYSVTVALGDNISNLNFGNQLIRPVLTNVASNPVVYSGIGSVPVTTSVTVSDLASETLAGATIQISGGYQNGSDSLLFTNTTNIIGTWDAGTGTLTLQGVDSLANYQTALRLVQFQNVGTSTVARNISFQITDGTQTSVTVSRIVDAIPRILSMVPVNGNLSTGFATQFRVAFSEPIESGTFTVNNLFLANNSGPNLISSAVSIRLVPGQTATYQISGLDGVATAEGRYVFTINASGVKDLAGLVGSNSLSTTWLVDTTPPTSTVEPLPAITTSPEVLVFLSGNDLSGTGESLSSGISSYAIYVSVNGESYNLWTTLPTSIQSAVYPGHNGETYSFYSIATDNAGNVQPTPSGAQAVTKVVTLALDAGPDQSLTRGRSVSLSGASYISNKPISQLSMQIDWGDGTTEIGQLVQGTGGGVISNSHAYQRVGSYTVTLSLSDNRGDHVSKQLIVAVANAPLTNTTSSLTLSSVIASSTGNIVLGSFTDGNPSASLSDFTASVNWEGPLIGTPTVVVQLVSRSNSVSTWQIVGNATYAKIGNWTPEVTLSDVDGSVLHMTQTTFNVTGYPTQILSYSIQKGQTQRSYLRYFDIDFSNTAGLSRFVNGQGIQLVRYDLNGLNPTVIPLAGLITLKGTHMTIDFGANGIGGNRLSNAGDGTYSLSFDLDGSGTFGTPIKFTRLLGDVTGDGSVDASDITAYQSNLKIGDLNGDVNGDGILNSADLLLIRNAQGRKIKRPV